MQITILAVAILPLIPNALAWGAVGHQTVALVAQNYLTAETKAWVSNILGETMASAATWADSYRYTTPGKWSAELHYIDSNDSPPHSCGVVFDRDCADGCIVSAIANYTTRVQDSSLAVEQTQDALKFLIHFFGDITQPLHCEALDVGGNTIGVTWNGATTNLHAVWDTPIPETLAGGSTLASATSWSKTLVKAIDSGIYANQTAQWTACSSITNAQNCALSWATDSNLHVCSDVLAGGIASVEDKELSGAYYTKAAPIVSEQIAKGGVRLANWLNKLHVAQSQQSLFDFA